MHSRPLLQTGQGPAEAGARGSPAPTLWLPAQLGVTVGQGCSSVSQLLHGSSADSQGLPQLTQQLGEHGSTGAGSSERVDSPPGAGHAGTWSLRGWLRLNR